MFVVTFKAYKSLSLYHLTIDMVFLNLSFMYHITTIVNGFKCHLRKISVSNSVLIVTFMVPQSYVVVVNL